MSMQNGRHLCRRHFQMHFLMKSLYFDSNFPQFFDNRPALVSVMAWHQTGDKPLPEQIMTEFHNAI